MFDKSVIQIFAELINPPSSDPRGAVLLHGGTRECFLHYSALQTFDSRVSLCATPASFIWRLRTDPLIKVVFLFEYDLHTDVQQALAELCERFTALHIITVKVVPNPHPEESSRDFDVAYSPFRADASASADRVHRETKQALDRVACLLSANPTAETAAT